MAPGRSRRKTILVACAVLAVGCSASHHSAPAPTRRVTTATTLAGGIRPLHGQTLTSPTRLRVLIGSSPPVLLNVDARARQRLTGVPAQPDRLTWVQPAGSGALISSTSRTGDMSNYWFFLPRRTVTAHLVGVARSAAASPDGRHIWLDTHHGTTCTLREVTSTGQQQSSRPIDCQYQIRADTALGLLVSRGDDNDAILAPETARPDHCRRAHLRRRRHACPGQPGRLRQG